MDDHPNKHIRAAVDYAVAKGWRLVKSGSRAHAWGRLFCAASTSGGCIISVYSTPRVPENHARSISAASIAVRTKKLLSSRRQAHEDL
jgi:hypothetical protein